ncbi:hypothetical protein BTVI_106387 [Pitangus sulphuratus]|nr:hypothetical protein BTVI_106387 [Pitangus sulphuratus]
MVDIHAMVPQGQASEHESKYSPFFLIVKRGEKSHIQRVVVNGSEFQCTSVTSGVPQGPILGSVLFNIYINDIDKRIKDTLIKFADDTKLKGVVATPEGHDAIQRDPVVKFEKCIHGNLRRFYKAKCKELDLVGATPGISTG